VRAVASIAANSILVTQQGRSDPLFVGQPLDVSLVLLPTTSLAQIVMVLDGKIYFPTLARGQSGRASFLVDGTLVREGTMRFTLAPRSFPDHDDGNPILVELQIIADRQRAIVLVRPSVLTLVNDERGMPVVHTDRVSDGDRDTFKSLLEEETGLTLEIYELPWVDDALATVTGYVKDAADPRVAILMDELARASLRTPGFEDAVWLALVPNEPPPVPLTPNNGGRAGSTGNVVLLSKRSTPSITPNAAGDGFGVSSFSVVAASLVVANIDGALARLRSVFEDEAAVIKQGQLLVAPTAPRLRLSGYVAEDGSFAIDPPMEEQRQASNGHATDAGIDAFAVDALGRTMSRVAFECVKNEPPQAVVALLPVSQDVAFVEIRKRPESDIVLGALAKVTPRRIDGDLLAKVTRYAFKPRLDLVSLEDIGEDASEALEDPAEEEKEKADPKDPEAAEEKDPVEEAAEEAIEGPTLRWLYSHPLKARGELFVELKVNADAAEHRSRPMISSVLRLDPEKLEATLPLIRFAVDAELRLVATDGWNRFVWPDDSKDPDAAQNPLKVNRRSAPTVVVRRLQNGLFWADRSTDKLEDTIHWVLGVTPIPFLQADRLPLQLSSKVRGVLRVVVGADEDEVVDWRPVGEEPHAYDRP
jgi:hypothetical protein